MEHPIKTSRRAPVRIAFRLMFNLSFSITRKSSRCHDNNERQGKIMHPLNSYEKTCRELDPNILIY